MAPKQQQTNAQTNILCDADDNSNVSQTEQLQINFASLFICWLVNSNYIYVIKHCFYIYTNSNGCKFQKVVSHFSFFFYLS